MCEGHLECATCHVIIESEEQFQQLPPATDAEEDMLEYAIGRKEGSRLCCQLKATPEMDQIIFSLGR